MNRSSSKVKLGVLLIAFATAGVADAALIFGWCAPPGGVPSGCPENTRFKVTTSSTPGSVDVTIDIPGCAVGGFTVSGSDIATLSCANCTITLTPCAGKTWTTATKWSDIC